MSSSASLFFLATVMPCFPATSAFAQAPEGNKSEPSKAVIDVPADRSATTPVPASTASQPPAKGPSETQFLSVPPRSLSEMRLHRASFPDEASLRCGLLESCVFGLTRGFAVGSDVAGTLASLVLQPQLKAGAWLSAGGFVGFQFLQGVDKSFWANGTVGWRTSRFRDSNDNEVGSSGFTGSIDFSQQISGFFSLGLRFEAVFSRADKLNHQERMYQDDNPGAHTRDALATWFGASHGKPTFWLSLPSDIELLNWKASHLDLPSDIHGYVRAEPFFAQNDFRLNDGFSWSEQDFGLRAGVLAAYESSKERLSRRYALRAHVGLELAFTRSKHSADLAPSGVTFDLSARAPVSGFADLEASWQF